MSRYRSDYFVEYERTWKYFQKMLDPRSRFAIMRIEAGPMMGKTWLLSHMENYCRDNDIPVALINFDNPLDDVSDFVSLLQTVSERFDLPDHFAPLQSAIDQYQISQQVLPLSALQKLADHLLGYFLSMNDLQRLARGLDLNLANLDGSTLSEKAYSLVLYFFERRILQTLLNAVETVRETVTFDWVPFLSEIEAVTPQTTITASSLQGGHQENTPIQNELNDKFFECVADLIEQNELVVFLFDAYENAPTEVRLWIKQQLLPRFTDTDLSDMVLVVGGTMGVSDMVSAEINSILLPVPGSSTALYPLEPFGLTEVKFYMEDIRNLAEAPPEIEWKDLHFYLDGVPGMIARKADKIERMQNQRDGKDDPFFF